MIPDYLAIGHITRDLLPDGTSTPGGTALFAALVAARLGCPAAVLSAGAPEHTPAPPAGVELALVPASHSSTFENRYGPSGRTQWLHAVAPPIDLASLPPAWRGAPIVHLGPLTNECEPAMAAAFPGTLVLATPQGWMRAWDEPLPAPVRRVPWLPAPPVLRALSLLVLSIEDVDGDEALAASYAAHCSLVALTRGAAGATFFVRGAPHYVAPFRAVERDPTGAGDVFAAALAIRLRETGDPLGAARFASAAAACVVEATGTAAIPTREQVLARLAEL
jgi:hypothetical protein